MTDFNDQGGFSEGRRLRLQVNWLDRRDEECWVHTYTHESHTRGAFNSHCEGWHEAGFDILMFHVTLTNLSPGVVRFRLRKFVLVGRDDRTFAPINVRHKAGYPPHFLRERAKIPPGGRLSGWLTFDGRVQGLVPGSLSYVDRAQTLTQIFQGKHRINRP